MPELTKDSRKVLKAIYDKYLERRKDGQSKGAAMNFSSMESEQFQGLTDASPELKRAGFIKENIIGDFSLTDKAIIFMENFTKDTIVKWLEFGSNFIP